MSDDSQGVITQMHLTTIEKWMEQSHQVQMETSKSISELANNLNELVTQEKLRTQRDAQIAEQIQEIKGKQEKYEDTWKWSKSMMDIWQAYVKRVLGPLIISGIIIAILATGGFAIYQGG